jgi:hypothetical protein
MSVIPPPAGKMIRKGAKAALTTGIVAGSEALGTAMGAPGVGTTVASAVAPTLADMAIKKAGLGVKDVVLNDNFNTFLNTFHPAMNPGMPMPDHSVRGAGLRAPGYTHGGRLRRSAEVNNVQPVGSPMNPTLPMDDHSVPR